MAWSVVVDRPQSVGQCHGVPSAGRQVPRGDGLAKI